MRSTTRTIATLVCGGFLVAACSGAGATPTPAAVTLAPASPTPAVAPPTTVPTPASVPMTDGQGPEHFSGTSGGPPTLVVPYTQTTVGDVVQYRGGVAAWDFTTTDIRTTGHARLSFSIDAYGSVGPEWGTLEIANTDGGWTGPCSAASWASGERIVLGCWLVGSGAFIGFGAYLSLFNLSGGVGSIEGVIFPGSPPEH